MNKPLIVRRSNGEFSTVEIPNAYIETMWFGDDGSQVLVGRTYITLAGVAEKHIKQYESEQVTA